MQIKYDLDKVVYSDVFGQSFYFLPDNRRMIFGQAARFWGTANVTPKRTESRGLGVEDPQELSSLFLSGFHAARVHGQIDRCPFFMRLSAKSALAAAFRKSAFVQGIRRNHWRRPWESPTSISARWKTELRLHPFRTL